MPYIPEERRNLLRRVMMEVPETAGELNYIFCDIIHQYLMYHPHCYQTMNDVLGAIEGAKAEFYRKVVIPYEQTKEEENGAVF